MKKTILPLCVLLFSSLGYSQDLASLLNPSLRALQNFHDAANPVSCFDYSTQNPTVIETSEERGCGRNGFQDVQVGKFRKMTRQRYQSGNYLLSRPAPNKFQAILNMRFVADPTPANADAGGLPGTPAMAQQMLQRTRNCLNEMKPYLKGPNGEELEIILATPDSVLPDGMPKPAVTEVKVTNQKPGFRGDAGNFGTNFECQTIGHEMLHHLGLCDEYHEGIVNNPGYPSADWSCRPVTAQNSYMRNMLYAFQTQVPQTSRCECDQTCQSIMNAGGKVRDIYLSMNGDDILNTESSLTTENTDLNPDRHICTVAENKFLEWGQEPAKAFEFDSESGQTYKFNSYRVSQYDGTKALYSKLVYSCTCKPHQTHCKKIIDQLKVSANNIPKRVTCPYGLKANSTGPSIGRDPSGSRTADCRTVAGKQVCDLVLTSEGNGQSLLAPSHFYKILGGNCRGSAPNYERCEPYAYIGQNSNECKQMPAECLNDDFYLNQRRALTAPPAPRR
jgi:hypothetical protein